MQKYLRGLRDKTSSFMLACLAVAGLSAGDDVTALLSGRGGGTTLPLKRAIVSKWAFTSAIRFLLSNHRTDSGHHLSTTSERRH